ncbi:MAG: tRNA preQ1(34) S-adenosylmethionine ribosyltransferase-isomerase QueA [Verrucomicrobiota bacterium]|nr:tRNA preQ1(34) S-adenosylmethionine ribosyltransferase-isomerase QueA [Verrucomicrobiota bacterium]
MLTSDFDYELPPYLIAQEPLPERSQSRMMVVDRRADSIEHRRVSDLPDILKSGDLLVLNDTRVIPARLFGWRSDTGGRVELLLVERLHFGTAEVDDARAHTEEWTALFRASGRMKPGVELALGSGRLTAEVLDTGRDGSIRVRLNATAPILEVLDREGFAPVPPYIKRRPERDEAARLDRKRYQTVFARNPGAVAAPTAGLHFTEELFARLEDCGVRRAMVTLHVGPGTFRPVRTVRVEDHRMEAERYEIGDETVAAINDARDAGGRIVAVGSTTIRALESAMQARSFLMAGSGRASLFIRPPFEFRTADAMLTNFHLPKSTLLMMICSFAGWTPGPDGPIARDSGRAGTERILRAYREAVRARYRFYSYGDCMLIL